jgi:hypothetical protein
MIKLVLTENVVKQSIRNYTRLCVCSRKKKVEETILFVPIAIYDKNNVHSKNGDYRKVSSKYLTLYPYLKVFQFDCFFS